MDKQTQKYMSDRLDAAVRLQGQIETLRGDIASMKNCGLVIWINGQRQAFSQKDIDGGLAMGILAAARDAAIVAAEAALAELEAKYAAL